MSKILIIYFSKTGNTKKMAEVIYEEINSDKEIDVEIKSVEEVNIDELLKADGIIIGSPTYYGSMSWEIKKLFDDSVKFHGALDGKVGAAFTSSGNIAGGNETTIMDIIKAMLIHGMIVYGDPAKDHYGPVAITDPDDRAKNQCIRLAQRVTSLVKKLKA
jgi:NAD(P)H dehydrogenase (quinone)